MSLVFDLGLDSKDRKKECSKCPNKGGICQIYELKDYDGKEVSEILKPCHALKALYDNILSRPANDITEYVLQSKATPPTTTYYIQFCSEAPAADKQAFCSKVFMRILDNVGTEKKKLE